MPALRIHGYVLAISFCFIILKAATHQTDPSEVNALKDIKKTLIDPMNSLRNWNEGDHAHKIGLGFGVLIVLGLMVTSMSANSPQIGQLSHLQIMNFMWNNLTGKIPKEIGNITSLKLLLLNGNKLTGNLPDKLGNLSKLIRFQVDQNQLSGPIPQSFTNLIKVRHLHMNNNSFNGQIPHDLSSYPSFSTCMLVDNNNLSGYLPPEFSMLPELRILQLDNNNFSRTGIPSTYANLSRLVKLSLRNCSLQGAIPDFSSISNLSYIDLSWNLLTGPIPSNKLSDNITTIDLSNNYLNGSIPRSFSYLPRLQELSLKNNFLSGSIPTSIWKNMSFSMNAKLAVDLRNNSLSDILGYMNPPENVTLRLAGNPICKNSSTQNIDQFCRTEADKGAKDSTSSTVHCPVQACPVDNFFEYVPASPIPCFCASPLRIGYQLKSPINVESEGSKTSASILIAATVASVACAIAISALVTFLIARRCAKCQYQLSRKRMSSDKSIRIVGMKTFTFKELALATDKFSSSNRVGTGGYGNVYKGILSDDTPVAIKRAEEGSLQGQKEFLTEIELLSRLHHRNLVSLIGYCNEKGEQILVYEFMPNGTLREWIFGKSKTKESLNFGTRLRIAMDSAKGILYLHTEANPPIFHRDIKASNILLDSNFTAKVADFGLSRLVPYLDDEGTMPKYVSTVVRGTPGYLDPEYLLTHKLTDKCDVYSLGIVFLELLTGMKPISHGKNIVRE
ncbi:Serine/threonine-protein kinase, active site, partial [Sesbania bispinosa]